MYEINRLLNKNGKTSESLQVKRYFNNKMSLYESLIYERLDYRSCREQRLFQHLK